MHGLESFSQLINFNFDTRVGGQQAHASCCGHALALALTRPRFFLHVQKYVIAAAPWRIVDAPRFQHREVLVDTSRHFEPVATLKNVIDSLVYAKLNGQWAEPCLWGGGALPVGRSFACGAEFCLWGGALPVGWSFACGAEPCLCWLLPSPLPTL